MDLTEEYGLLDGMPPPAKRVRVEEERAPTSALSSTDLMQYQYEVKLKALEQELSMARSQLASTQERESALNQELCRVHTEVSAWVRTKEKAVRPIVQPHLAPMSSPLLYADHTEFARIRAETIQARVDLLSGLSSDVAEKRLCEVQERHLTDFEVEQCLLRRKQVLEEKYTEDVPEGTPTEHVLTPVTQLKIQDAVLQLLKVLHRRRLAVLQGHKLPPLDSVFSSLPQ